MDWFLLAITSCMVMGLVSVLDKRLLVVHFPSVHSFAFMIGIIHWFLSILALTVVLLLFGMPHLGYMALACAAGALMACGIKFYFWGLTFEEVSRGTPIFGTSPLFAALLAVLFLSEELVGAQWAGVLAIMLGGSLLSFRPTPHRRGFIGGKALGVFLVGALLAGSALVLNKQASYELSIWALIASSSLGVAFSLTISAIRPTLVHQLVSVVRDRAAIRLFLITELALGTIGFVLLQTAIKLGPVSVVAGVLASKSLFTLIFSSLLSTRSWNLLDEPLDRQTLVLKAVSTVLIIVGLAGLAVY